MNPHATNSDSTQVIQIPITETVNTTYVNPNSLPREQRKELDLLSKEVFGSTSKWKKLVKEGYPVKATVQVSEEVPQDDGTTKVVEKQVPLKLNGAEYSTMKYHTVDSVKVMMLERKQQIADFKAMLQKHEEDRKIEEARKNLALEVQNQAGGSAI